MNKSSIKPSSPEGTFGQWCYNYRTSFGLTQRAFAKKLGICAAMVTAYEKKGQPPHLSTAHHIANRLQLEGAERENFFLAVLQSRGTTEFAEKVLADLHALSDNKKVSSDSVAALFSEIDGIVSMWKKRCEDNPVTRAIVPIAGWQSRVLSLEMTASVLVRIWKEAHDAGLKSIVAVVTNTQHHMIGLIEESDGRGCWELKRLQKNQRISFAVQERPISLASAVVSGARFLRRDEPFALMLPDDFPARVEGKPSYLSRLLNVYKKERCSTIGVTTLDAKVLKKAKTLHYGIAYCKERERDLLQVVELRERPRQFEKIESANNVSKVAGRYVFTNQIIDKLRILDAENNNRIEIADGVNRMLAEKHPVVALSFEGRINEIGQDVRRRIEEVLMRAISDE